MSEHKSLAEALAAFQESMPVVTKSKTAKVPTKSGGSYSYSYADLATVSEIAMPRLTAHGLSFTCAPRLTDAGHYELVGTLRHASGESTDGALPIKGGTPQELGSSITYARRYLLGAMTGIVTDDDDDGALASQQRQERQQRRRGTPAPQLDKPGETGEAATAQQVKKLNILLREAGHETDADRYQWLSAGCRREITSSKQLTKAEASRAIDALEKQRPTAPTDDPDGGAPWPTEGEQA